MPLTLPLKTLQDTINLVLPAIDMKPTNPALGAVRMEPRDGEVEFAATNGTLSIRVRRFVKGLQAAKVMLLPAARLSSYVRLLDGDPVELSSAGIALRIRCGGADTRFALVPSGSYPLLDLAPEEGALVIPLATVGRMLRFTSFAALQDAKESPLRCALLEVVDGKLHVVATNSHQLAHYVVDIDAKPFRMLLSDAALGALSKVSTGGEGDCAISQTDEAVFVSCTDEDGAVHVSHRLVNGTFPRYEKIIPQKAEASVRISATSLMGAVRRCVSVGGGKGVVTIALAPNTLTLSAVDAETGETTERLQGVSPFQFPEAKVTFSGRYLHEALRRLDGRMVLSLARVGANLGLWIQHEVARGESFEYVLMGMKEHK